MEHLGQLSNMVSKELIIHSAKLIIAHECTMLVTMLFSKWDVEKRLMRPITAFKWEEGKIVDN